LKPRADEVGQSGSANADRAVCRHSPADAHDKLRDPCPRQKRAGLSGEIENTQTALKQVIQELEHLDKTLLMFHSDYWMDAIRPKAFRTQ
jgi:hypothetical protein